MCSAPQARGRAYLKASQAGDEPLGVHFYFYPPLGLLRYTAPPVPVPNMAPHRVRGLAQPPLAKQPQKPQKSEIFGVPEIFGVLWVAKQPSTIFGVQW